ncbi:hypothetical protein HYH02_000509 [Chlamydomonas schloesseri]|uniref:Major facilitator superfamily (MFS) profile domain-containing protein n=1 Tax=Chlamydomonas schloesseri TaxID=2026947 RepID=A0A836BDH8_9CHLO|nr:hypothetical protein HYH02_000509 [Chlamydomonas schloesseri]|eukprot:KAG2454670.1 hypothetical protein HYH02_000509 [Chlamydomonas schloesseri]
MGDRDAKDRQGNEAVHTFDEVLERCVGAFGRGQLLLLVLASTSHIAMAALLMLMVFTGQDPIPVSGAWRCEPGSPALPACARVLAAISGTSLSSPGSSNHVPAASPDSFGSSNTGPALGDVPFPIQDLSTPAAVRAAFCALPTGAATWTAPATSLLSYYGLTCGREWYVSLLNSLYFVGLAIGGTVFGAASDRWGRRVCLYGCAALAAGASVAESVMPAAAAAAGFWAHGVFRLLAAAAIQGMAIADVVLVTELVGPDYRGRVGILTQSFFIAGECLLALLAAYVRDWRLLTLLCAALPAAFLATRLVVPESPRWLAAAGRRREAAATLASLARLNGRGERPESSTAAIEAALGVALDSDSDSDSDLDWGTHASAGGRRPDKGKGKGKGTAAGCVEERQALCGEGDLEAGPLLLPRGVQDSVHRGAPRATAVAAAAAAAVAAVAAPGGDAVASAADEAAGDSSTLQGLPVEALLGVQEEGEEASLLVCIQRWPGDGSGGNGAEQACGSNIDDSAYGDDHTGSGSGSGSGSGGAASGGCTGGGAASTRAARVVAAAAAAPAAIKGANAPPAPPPHAEKHQHRHAPPPTLREAARHPLVLSYFGLLSFALCTLVLSYYGIGFALSYIPGSLYLSFFLISIAEAPSSLVVGLLIDRVGRCGLVLGGMAVSGLACIGCGLAEGAPVAQVLLAMLGKFGSSGAWAVLVVYCAEVFPTSVRSVASGAIFQGARVGGVAAPFVFLLGDATGVQQAPFWLMGGVTLAAACLCVRLPETAGCDQPETLQQLEANKGRTTLALARRWWAERGGRRGRAGGQAQEAGGGGSGGGLKGVEAGGQGEGEQRPLLSAVGAVGSTGTGSTAA